MPRERLLVGGRRCDPEWISIRVRRQKIPQPRETLSYAGKPQPRFRDGCAATSNETLPCGMDARELHADKSLLVCMRMSSAPNLNSCTDRLPVDCLH